MLLHNTFSCHNLGVLSADFQANLAEIVSTEDRARYCFKNEWNLGKYFFSDELPFDWEIIFHNNFQFYWS